MASKTRTEMLPLGPCVVTLDGVNAGYVEEVMASLEILETPTTAGDTGGADGTEHDIFHKATKVRVEMTLDQVNLTILQKATGGATRSTSGADEKVSFGKVAGVAETAQELVITPMASGIATSRVFKVYRAVPTDSREITFANEQQKTKVVFKGLWDSGRTNGDNLCAFGTQSVAADTTAPTVSSYLPLDDGTMAVTDPFIVTFSEQMDPASINTDNVAVFLATESGVQSKVPVTVALSDSGLVLTVTPVSALTASTQYNLWLNSGLKDAAGNRFAGKKSSHTTT